MAHLPKRLNPRREMVLEHVENAAGVHDHEGDRQDHGGQHDPEPRTDLDELPETKVVVSFDRVEE